jgi:UDP-N-acetylmuramoyl-L-alanyl-D-glutamate--2,6-diaminopimelate ligase
VSVTLGDLIERLERGRGRPSATELSERDASREITDLSADSRRVRPGTLFCAIRGTSGDGHHYLREAAAAGAVAALVEQRDPALDLPQVEVSDSRRAAAHAASAFFADPWNDLALLGVTGTNGKTTTVWILRHLLAGRGPAASIGTLGVVGPAGEPLPGTEGLTTPGPIELARLIRRLADSGVEALAMEVSSHALQQARVAALRYNVAIFTNLSRDHLDYHGSLERYRAAKLRLLELLAPDSAVVINGDDPAWKGIEPRTARLVRFGADEAAEVRAEEVAAVAEAVEWTLHTPSGSARVRLPLLGAYNVSNALAAAAALWSLGWGAEEIAERLGTVPQVPGRLERVPVTRGSPSVVIDFAHTPDALERALSTVRTVVRGRLLVVFGAGGDRDPGKRPEMGRAVARFADLAIVTSDNPRTEDPERIAEEIESGMGDAPRLRVLDRREAIRRALAMGTEEDLILLAGKGHESYQIWGDERRPFDERAVVREILDAKDPER